MSALRRDDRTGLFDWLGGWWVGQVQVGLFFVGQKAILKVTSATFAQRKSPTRLASQPSRTSPFCHLCAVFWIHSGPQSILNLRVEYLLTSGVIWQNWIPMRRSSTKRLLFSFSPWMYLNSLLNPAFIAASESIPVSWVLTQLVASYVRIS